MSKRQGRCFSERAATIVSSLRVCARSHRGCADERGDDSVPPVGDRAGSVEEVVPACVVNNAYVSQENSFKYKHCCRGSCFPTRIACLSTKGLLQRQPQSARRSHSSPRR